MDIGKAFVGIAALHEATYTTRRVAFEAHFVRLATVATDLPEQIATLGSQYVEIFDRIGRGHPQDGEPSLADFGFVVVRFWALGTALRSKAMQDYFYGHVLDNGLPDLVSAIKQLSGRYPWIDAARAGIVGHSGGGYTATAGMLLHPDFFKVGVEESGNNDFRVYGWYWGEKYQGMLDSPAAAKSYGEQASYRYAANLKGKLLLIHGDMDCNNPTAETLRVVNALIENNKPFDMLIVPDAGHQLPGYVMKRVWNYFITNLLGEEPRDDYQVMKVGPWASFQLRDSSLDGDE